MKKFVAERARRDRGNIGEKTQDGVALAEKPARGSASTAAPSVTNKKKPASGTGEVNRIGITTPGTTTAHPLANMAAFKRLHDHMCGPDSRGAGGGDGVNSFMESLLEVSSENGPGARDPQMAMMAKMMSSVFGGDGSVSDQLYTAAELGKVSAVRERLAKKGCDVNYKYTDNSTPLLIASSRGHAEVQSYFPEGRGEGAG